MKSFYSPVVESSLAVTTGAVMTARAHAIVIDGPIDIRSRARIAVYDALSAAPRVVEVEPAPVGEFIESLSAHVHELCRQEGNSMPHTVIREITENFIHAGFAELVISILDAGSTIRFADQGPGISDKERVLLPGFTTAHGEMKQFIRGVGSGLPIVRDYLVHSGGSLSIEDNLGTGTVVTIRTSGTGGSSLPRLEASVHDASSSMSTARASQQSTLSLLEPVAVARPRLTARQKHVLALVLESGLAGPSLVAKELGVGVSTAYRDLASLEDLGLIVSESGKRTLTADGLAYLGELTNRS